MEREDYSTSAPGPAVQISRHTADSQICPGNPAASQRSSLRYICKLLASCQVSGCAALYPRAQTVMDIGGQDCKISALSEGGRVRDFTLNDRCAAGTARFLDMVAAIVVARVKPARCGKVG